jgi:hypothetical protein
MLPLPMSVNFQFSFEMATSEFESNSYESEWTVPTVP